MTPLSRRAPIFLLVLALSAGAPFVSCSRGPEADEPPPAARTEEAPPAAPADLGIAALLPGDASMYVRLDNVPRMLGQIEKHAGERLLLQWLSGDPEEAEAARRLLQQVRSLHVSGFFGRPKGLRGDVAQEIILIAELANAAPLAKLVGPRLMRDLENAGVHDRTTIYRAARTGRDKRESSPYVAGCKDKLILAEKREQMEAVLDAIGAGRADSLAANRDVQKLAAGLKPKDATLWLSVSALMKAILRDSRDPAGDRVTSEIFGFGDMTIAVATTDYGARAGRARVAMAPGSLLYELAAQPPARMEIPRCLPSRAAVYMGATVADGRRLWTLVDRVVRNLAAARGAGGGQVYDQALRAMRTQWDLDLADLMSQVREVGLSVELSRRQPPGVCLFLRVKDPGNARRMIGRIEASDGFRAAFPDGATKERHHGETVCTVGGRLQWAVVGDCILLAPAGDLVSRAIEARTRGTGLSTSKNYGSVIRSLAERKTFFVFVDFQTLARGGALDMDHAPPAAKEIIENLAYGLSLTAGNGILEGTWALNEPLDWGRLVTAIGQRKRAPDRR